MRFSDDVKARLRELSVVKTNILIIEINNYAIQINLELCMDFIQQQKQM